MNAKFLRQLNLILIWVCIFIVFNYNPNQFSVKAQIPDPNQMLGSISGWVTSLSTNDQIQGAMVRAEDFYSGQRIGESTTNLLGSYNITGLPTGDYYVIVEPPDGYAHQVYSTNSVFSQVFNWEDATPVHVNAPDPTYVDFQLPAGGKILGRVVDADNIGVGGVMVIAGLYDTDKGWGFRTDADGDFLIKGLIEGQYRVWAESKEGLGTTYYNETASTLNHDEASLVQVTPPYDTEYINITMLPTGSISGIVRDRATGLPLGGNRICVDNDQTNFGTCQDGNSDGTYRVIGIPTGDYRVHVEPPPGYAKQVWENSFNWDPYLPVHVEAPGDTPNINFNLDPGANISGRVTDSAGNPLVNVMIHAFQNREWGSAWSTDSRSDGSFTITGLQSGNYIVRAELEGYAVQFYNGAADWDTAEYVPVFPPADTLNINFTLTPAAHLSGHVTDADTREPVVSAFIMAVGEDFSLSTCTDDSGYYELNSIPLNISFTLRVGLTPCGDLEQVYPRWFWQNAKDVLEATPIIATQPGDLGDNYDFALQKGGFIEGSVYGENGELMTSGDFGVVSLRADQVVAWGFDGTMWSGHYRIATHPGDQKIVLCGTSCGESFPDLYYDQRADFESATVLSVEYGQTMSNIDFYLGGITHAGDESTVNPRPEVTINYTQTSDGFTYASIITPTEIPANFKLLGNSYSIQTTATFISAQVCLPYNDSGLSQEEEHALYLGHFEDDSWIYIRDDGYPDTVANIVCGTVSQFSPFAIFLPPKLDWLPPITNLLNGEIYQMTDGSTIPIKFTITDWKGTFVHEDDIKVMISGLDGSNVVFVSGSADSGIRISDVDKQYIVNLHVSDYTWLQSGSDYHYNIEVFFGDTLLGSLNFELLDGGKTKKD